ncbi:MAG: PEP-utilizing enzyme [Candidatus Buchananbacteria bacterium]
MKKKIGWGYRDQLLISQDNILTVYGSQRDQNNFIAFSKNKNKEYFSKINSIILFELKTAQKTVLKVDKLLTKENLSAPEMVAILKLMYKSYRGLYSVYRFSTVFDHFYQGKNKIELAKKFALTKDRCGKFFTKTDRTTLELIKENLSRILGLPKNLILFMNYQELTGSLQNSKAFVDINELKSRYHFYILLAVNNKIDLVTGSQAKSIQKKINFVDFKKNLNYFSGQVAYPGNVSGIVKVAYSINDLKNVKKNSILVTPMTTIAFVPFLKKFSAIITNEGGITCHAAIIAREIKIPCVIGTKIATEVLKNGDLIKVDGRHGVVTIVNKK